MKEGNMNWQIKSFENLSPDELYEIIKLRLKVFVSEQQCVAYDDLDDKDKKSYHVFTYDKGQVVAYCRILPPGVSYEETSIGRVVVDKEYRKNKLGYEMMQKAIEFVENELKEKEIKISAQTYVVNFYKSLGFTVISEEYLEENIPHMKMKRG